MLDCFPREKCERAAEKPRCFAVVLRFGGEKTHVSLRPSEERKFLEVIRDRHGRKGGVGGAAAQDFYCSGGGCHNSTHTPTLGAQGT